MSSAEWLPLWPGEAPGGAKPVVVKESEGEGGRLTDTAVPQYEVYLPDASSRTGAAVVIFPGGGYTILAAEHEGRDYAKWLNERGIVAVLAKYRVSGKDEAGFQFPVPLLDARRAIRVTRAKAKEWGVDPAKVGVMGSSAGGHLASMCATLWDEKFPEEGKDEIDRLDCRPDFAVLVYPVIAMAEPWCHGGSQAPLARCNAVPGTRGAGFHRKAGERARRRRVSWSMRRMTAACRCATRWNSPPAARKTSAGGVPRFRARRPWFRTAREKATRRTGRTCWNSGSSRMKLAKEP